MSARCGAGENVVGTISGVTISGRDGGLLVSVITGGRERASTVSLGRRHPRRGGGVLLVLASAALGCTVTGDDFEPTRVVSEETGGLNGAEVPSPPAQDPSGDAPGLFPAPEDDGADPNGALAPADTDNDANGASSGGASLDAGPDGGEATDGGEAGTLDAGVPQGTELPPSSSSPDASAPTASPPAEPEPSEPELSEPEPAEPEPSEPEPSEPELSEPEPSEPEPSEPEPPACPGVVFDESCYQFSPERVSWRVAEERCVAWGGHLASIETFEEDFFIAVWPALLGVPVGDGSGIWLGGTDEGRDGDFRWVDDGPLRFVGWAPNQPDNGQGVDCIQKRNDGGERWYDLRCTDAQPYVCERPE